MGSVGPLALHKMGEVGHSTVSLKPQGGRLPRGGWLPGTGMPWTLRTVGAQTIVDIAEDMQRNLSMHDTAGNIEDNITSMDQSFWKHSTGYRTDSTQYTLVCWGRCSKPLKLLHYH